MASESGCARMIADKFRSLMGAVHMPSFCAGGAIAAFLCRWLSLRASPPWLLHALMAPEVKRTAWDAHKRKKELEARPQRKRAVRIYLIRHAQSMANQHGGIVGGRDVKTLLTEHGEAQARLLGERLHREGVAFDRIFASHAVRARRTAEIASAGLGFKGKIEEEPRVVEFCQGSLELQPRADVYREDGPVKRGIRRDGNLFYRPPGWSPDGVRGESAWDTEVRYCEFVDELLDDGGANSEKELVVAVFTHGMSLKSFVRGAISASPSFSVTAQIENTSITEMLYKPQKLDELGGWSLVRFNDSSHLS